MLGLALEGGGAKGAYQVGAYKALLEKGYNFSCIAGTSIGSINAALICQGDFALLEKVWYEMDASIFNISPELVSSILNKNINQMVLKSGFGTIRTIIKNRGIDTANFRALLNKYIDEERVRQSKIKFGLVTMRLSDFTPLELTIDDIPKGKLIDYIMASCYLPVFRMNRIIDDRFYLDGGFTNVLPLTLLEKMGCNEIIGIRVKKFGLIKKQKNAKTKITIVQPCKNIGPIILIDKERSVLNARLGYLDTLNQITN